MLLFSNDSFDAGDSNAGGAAALLGGILDSAMDAIITVDEQQKIVMYNRAAETIFGWSRLEIAQQPVEMLIPGQFRATHARSVERYGETGVTTRRMGGRRVIHGLRRNGEEFPLEASISVLDTPRGKLFTAIVRDVTDLDRMQREQEGKDVLLRESHRKLLVAQRLARIGYWGIDLDTRLMWWCDEAHNVMGVDRALLDGSYDGFLGLIHAEDRQAFAFRRDAAVLAGLPLDAEFRVITPSGDVRWINMLSWVESSGDGEKPHRRTGVVREITDKKHAEGAIARSVELLNRTGALARVGGWELHVESMTWYCSEEIYSIHELEPSKGVDLLRDPLSFYAPEAQARIRAAVDAAIKQATPWDLELPLITAKGQHIWVRTQGRSDLQDGKLVRLFGVLQDITDIKATEAALRMSNQELEAFSYSVSHDLRSPLNSINGFSHLLSRKLTPNAADDVKHYLSRIRAATQQMGQLIEGLLALAQVSRTVLRNESVDLSEMARSILDDWQLCEPDRHVVMHVESGLQAQGDGRLIRVVMENLLENAWKFSSRTEHAEIRVGQIFDAAGELVFFVRDNGAGFEMAYADKLFTPFQRLHEVAEFPGMGIGLATVSRVITRHAGRLWAESEPGYGACFFFTLPRVPDAATGGPDSQVHKRIGPSSPA